MNTRRTLLPLTFAILACIGIAGAGQPPNILPPGVELPPGTKVDEKGIFIPFPKPSGPFKRESLEDRLKSQKKMRDKKYWTTNGVEMAVTVQTAHWRGKATEIEFSWTLTYTGPRSPLIILEPSLTQPSGAQTNILFFAIPKESQQGRQVRFSSLIPWELKKPGEPAPKPDDPRLRLRFVTVEKGKTATGKTSFSVEKLKKRLLDEFPKEFDANTPPELWVEFVHYPINRGEIDSLDAWTGELKSHILTVPELKGW